MREPRVLTAAEYQQITDLAAEGVREGDICHRLNIHPDTWGELKKRDPEALRGGAMVAGFLDAFPQDEALTAGLVDVQTGPNWATVH